MDRSDKVESKGDHMGPTARVRRSVLLDLSAIG